MSMTKEQIRDIIAKRLNKGAMDTANWGDLVSSVQAMTAAERQSLLNKIKTGQHNDAGLQLARALQGEVYKKAEAAADLMLADDTLSLAELEQVL